MSFSATPMTTMTERESSNSDDGPSSPRGKPDPVVEELLSLLKGQGLPRMKIDLVDGISDQPLTPRRHEHDEVRHREQEAKHPAVLGRSVSYVVAVIVTDADNNSMLMIQEAKPECHGLWYLPAGRVEHKESLVDAAKRETLEEAGLVLEPQTLVAIEMSHRGWFRFVFSGEIRGGRLKTTSDADQESIQATWLPVESMLKRSDKHHRLRSADILWLFEVVPDVIRQVVRENKYPPFLPIDRPRDRLYLCCILAFREESNLFVLASVRSGRHLPVVLISARDAALYSPLDRLLKDVWKKDSPVISYDPLGLLAVEHDPSDGDGLLIAILCLITTPDRRLPPVRNRDYTWTSLTSSSDPALILEQKLKKVDLTPVIVNV